MSSTIVIIGGGIQGAAVAREAALEGYKDVVVLERNEVGSGTSSKSTKLIHGGLRYLEHGHLRLVKESLKAREALLREHPDLVHKIPFLVPIYKNSSRSSWKVQLGLSIYNYLSKKQWKVHRVGNDQKNFLGVTPEGLVDVFQYEDAITDDRALTRRVMDEAVHLGVRLHEHAKILRIDPQPNGYDVVWEDDEGNVGIEPGATVINAAGPWVNDVLDLIDDGEIVRQRKKDIDLVAGTHIVAKVGNRSSVAFYLEALADKRPIFVVPYHNEQILIGTTEHPYRGSPDDIQPSGVDYLMETYNHYFPDKQITEDNIVDTFVGTRVLLPNKKGAHSSSREVCLHVDNPNSPKLLTVYGGKLTVHRSTARKVLNALRLERRR